MRNYELEHVFNNSCELPKALHVNLKTFNFYFRSGNILEIWDVKHTPHIDRVIIIDENDTVESVIWCGDRLFTSGIAGSVLEYDILNLSVKVSLICKLHLFTVFKLEYLLLIIKII